MGYYVHIHVVFECYDPEKILELARDRLIHHPPSQKDAKNFLTYLAAGKGYSGGPKGGLCLWGYTGNYTLVEDFCKSLYYFWERLWELHIGGAVHVFGQAESADFTQVYEIRPTKGADQLGPEWECSGPVRLRRHELPISLYF